MLISDLTIGRRLDGGAFGEVFEATDSVQGRVAVKTLRRQPGESDAAWTQRKTDLVGEGQRLKDAEHLNVVRVLQILDEPSADAVHLVLEYCDGGSLQGNFETGPMSLPQLRDALVDAALGIDAVHARGMLHRDVKPANLLRGRDNRIKVSDFGLVTNDLILGYAAGVGYWDHLAPEVYHTVLTSVRTDVWAFGMTAYRLLHGETFYNQLPSPRLLVPAGGFALGLPWLPHIPDRWRRFIRKCLSDDPHRRFASMAEVHRGLMGLPISPDWTCIYAPAEVRWERVINGRRIEVVWERLSPLRHQWRATSHPLAAGRSVARGGSHGIISPRKAIRQLDEFFAASK